MLLFSLKNVHRSLCGEFSYVLIYEKHLLSGQQDLKNVNKYIFEEINTFVQGSIQSKSDIFHIVTM